MSISPHLTYRDGTEFIIIGSYKAKLSCEKGSAPVDCLIYYALADDLQLIIEADITENPQQLLLFQSAQRNATTILLTIPGWKPFQVGIARSCVNCDTLGLIPINSNPEMDIKTEEFIHSATFQLVNFRFIGPGRITPQPEDLKPGYELRFGGWLLHIENDTLKMTDKFKALKSSRGYGVTHFAKLSKIDGSVFSTDGIKEVVETLRCALTFANGAFVSILNIKGFSANSVFSYHCLYQPLCEPWQERINWLDAYEISQLVHYLDQFFKACDNSPDFFTVAKQAIYWYARSNRSGFGPDSGIILSTAALESLSSYIVKNNSTACSRSCKNGCKLHCLISQAARVLNIPLGVDKTTEPKFMSVINDKSNNKVYDLSGAIPSVRNSLVHAKNTLEPAVLTEALHPTWNVSQWLIEEIVLCHIGYNYKNKNRDRRYLIPS